MSIGSLRCILNDDRGTALIEATIALPVILLLALGVFEFSLYFYQQHRVSTGIRDAARFIARSHDSPSDSALQLAAKNLATTGNILGGTARVAGWLPSDVHIALDSASCASPDYCRGGTTMQVVKVSTSFSPINLGFFGFFGLSPPEIKEGYYQRLIAGGS